MVDFSGLASIFDSFVVFHHSSTEDGQWRWSKNQFHPCCSFCQSAWHVDLFRGWGSTFDQTIAASLHVLVGPRFSRNVSSLWWPSKHVEHGTPTSCCQSLAYGTPSFGEGHGLVYFAFHLVSGFGYPWISYGLWMCCPCWSRLTPVYTATSCGHIQAELNDLSVPEPQYNFQWPMIRWTFCESSVGWCYDQSGFASFRVGILSILNNRTITHDTWR